MSRPQAHIESPSGGFLEEIVTFVVNVVEVARDWVASLWSPAVPTSAATQVKDALNPGSVAPPQKDDSSTTPNVSSDSVEERNPLPDVGTSGSNTEDSSVLPPKATDSAQENQPDHPPTRDVDDTTIAGRVEESKDEVPLVQDQDLGQAEPIHENAVATDSSQDWVPLSKHDAESPFTKAGDVQAEVPVPQHEDAQVESASPQQQEPTVEFSESTLIDAPTEVHESVMTTGSDTSTSPLSTPEPDTQSFDHAAVRIQTDAEEHAPLNPESNVEVGSASEAINARISTPSLNDAAINQGVSSELATKKQRGGSFIKRQSTLMNKVFKSRNGSGDNSNGPTNLTSPSKTSLTVDNQSISSSLVSEPEAMEHSTLAPDVSSADVPVDSKKIASPSRVSIGSIRSIGSIKKKFGRRGSTASDKDVASAVSAPDQESRLETSEPLNLNQPNKVVDATSSGPSLLKTMFKVRKPLKMDELRT